eukprot:TRINITY_DN84238_c0_g1_i1.p2 TRINITY_DN84238_c0_g1~~TRINITY_DN84238_c0_g1_i1.p2  ORF type:complete len:430 (+),score=96.04 TRINITY_DN84238_c0_g1_i1:58-1347(+)
MWKSMMGGGGEEEQKKEGSTSLWGKLSNSVANAEKFLDRLVGDDEGKHNLVQDSDSTLEREQEASEETPPTATSEQSSFWQNWQHDLDSGVGKFVNGFNSATEAVSRNFNDTVDKLSSQLDGELHLSLGTLLAQFPMPPHSAALKQKAARKPPPPQPQVQSPSSGSSSPSHAAEPVVSVSLSAPATPLTAPTSLTTAATGALLSDNLSDGDDELDFQKEFLSERQEEEARQTAEGSEVIETNRGQPDEEESSENVLTAETESRSAESQSPNRIDLSPQPTTEEGEIQPATDTCEVSTVEAEPEQSPEIETAEADEDTVEIVPSVTSSCIEDVKAEENDVVETKDEDGEEQKENANDLQTTPPASPSPPESKENGSLPASPTSPGEDDILEFEEVEIVGNADGATTVEQLEAVLSDVANDEQEKLPWEED